MTTPFLQDIRSLPGIKRDGTQFNSANYIDGQWIRFYDGLPRKIGGYRLINPGNTEIIRNMYQVSKVAASGGLRTIDLYLGRPDSLYFINFTVSPPGIGGIPTSRTPVDFVADSNNMWSFDLMSVGTPTDEPTSYESILFAVAAPNSDDINNDTEGLVYYGNINVNAPTPSPLSPVDSSEDPVIKCSGGLLVVGNYLFLYGNNGVVQYSAFNDPLTVANYTQVSIGGSGTKIVQGLRTRGGGFPGALFWSLDSLTRATFNPSADGPDFNFDTVSDDISILAANSVVKYKDLYYWIGVDKFWVFSGVSDPIPNTMVTDYFFNNINTANANKIFGIVLPLFSEIWWFCPFGDSPENNVVIMYNITEKVFYDSRVGRASGVSPGALEYPILGDSGTEKDRSINYPPPSVPADVYGIWMHEFGTDKELYNQVLAIPSWFETNLKTLFDQNPQANFNMRSVRIEPDFSNFTGNMQLIVNTRGFAQGPITSSDPITFNASTTHIDLTVQGRLTSYKFISNESGGYFEMGKTMLNYTPGNPRPAT